MKDSYLKNINRWEVELGETVPRRVRIKVAFLFLLPLLFVFVSIISTVAVSLIISEITHKNNLINDNLVFVFFIFVSFFIFSYFSLKEKKSIQNWKKITGKIEEIVFSYSFGWVWRRVPTFKINYQYDGESFSKKIGEHGGLSNAEKGDPVILLVNPENPNLFISYGGSAWKATNRHN